MNGAAAHILSVRLVGPYYLKARPISISNGKGGFVQG
jgi:hypothetical protein